MLIMKAKAFGIRLAFLRTHFLVINNSTNIVVLKLLTIFSDTRTRFRPEANKTILILFFNLDVLCLLFCFIGCSNSRWISTNSRVFDTLLLNSFNHWWIFDSIYPLMDIFGNVIHFFVCWSLSSWSSCCWLLLIGLIRLLLWWI